MIRPELTTWRPVDQNLGKRRLFEHHAAGYDNDDEYLFDHQFQGPILERIVVGHGDGRDRDGKQQGVAEVHLYAGIDNTRVKLNEFKEKLEERRREQSA